MKNTYYLAECRGCAAVSDVASIDMQKYELAGRVAEWVRNDKLVRLITNDEPVPVSLSSCVCHDLREDNEAMEAYEAKTHCKEDNPQTLLDSDILQAGDEFRYKDGGTPVTWHPIHESVYGNSVRDAHPLTFDYRRI